MSCFDSLNQVVNACGDRECNGPFRMWVEDSFTIRGAGTVGANAKAIELSGSPGDVNSLEEPIKVSPKEHDVSDAAATMQRTFAPHSLTLLRINATSK